MRRRFKPRTLPEFLIYAVVIVVGMGILYATTIHMLKTITENNLQRLESMKKPSMPMAPAAAPKPRTVPAPKAATIQPTEAELQQQRERETALAARQAAEQKKKAAWERFYQPPRACLHPESVQRAEVCRANEQKQRKEFESAWAEQLLRERQAQQ